MNVNNIKNIIASLVSGEKSGHKLGLEDYNLYLQKANLDLLNQRTKELGTSQGITDTLMPFKVRTGLTFLSGAAALPSDYVSFLAMYDPVNEVSIEILDDSEIGDRLNNPITAPTTTYPVAFFVNNQVNILPTTIETITGTADAGGSGTALVRKTGTGFESSGINVRSLIRNTTDGSWAEVVTITDDDNIVTTALQGGTDNTWSEDDAYSVGIEMHYIKQPATPAYVWVLDAYDRPRYLAADFYTLTVTTSATTIGFTHGITVNYNAEGVVSICNFTATTISAQDLAQGMAESVNELHETTGYFASVGTNEFTIYLNSSVGANTDYVVAETGTGVANFVAATPLEDGTGGSVEFEWDEIEHTDIIRLIIGYTGINIKDSLVIQAIEREKQENIK